MISEYERYALQTDSSGQIARTLQDAGNALPDFRISADLEASEPPEARGLARDEVRLLVSSLNSDRFQHTTFRKFPRFLEAGDVLVINTSGTLPAALEGSRPDSSQIEFHLSNKLRTDLWVAEIRMVEGKKIVPFFQAKTGEIISLPGGASARLLAPMNNSSSLTNGRVRLWLVQLNLPKPVGEYLREYGFPIRYDYVQKQWPITYYQTVYANELGSAEMPSAGRAFTPELITELVAKGVQVAPLVLHTGVASLEKGERPYKEAYRVPSITANVVNAGISAGKKIVAVGTTVVRALETVTDEKGVAHPGKGWTDLIISSRRRLRVVSGLLTGFHEPSASHLTLLEALSGRHHLFLAYQEALRERYLWHEFGDLHLILP